MFYFILTNFFQAIEAQDPEHKCKEYWDHKEVDCVSCSSDSSGDIKTKLFGVSLVNKEQDKIEGSCHSFSFDEMKSLLQGLLKKASPDELSAMHKLFSSDEHFTQWRAAFVKLIEEIHKA